MYRSLLQYSQTAASVTCPKAGLPLVACLNIITARFRPDIPFIYKLVEAARLTVAPLPLSTLRVDGALELEPAQDLGPGLQPQASLGQGSAPLFGRTRAFFEVEVDRSEDSGDRLLPILGLKLVDQLQNTRWV